jgi:ethanolamine transporter EutH
MGGRVWLWMGAGLNLILLAAASYMAITAVDVVSRSDRSPLAIGIAVVFLALPVVCTAALVAVWRAQQRGRSYVRIAALFAAPWIYAAFLVVFVNYA